MWAAVLVVFIGLNIGQGLFLAVVLVARLLIALAVRLGFARPKRRMGTNAR